MARSASSRYGKGPTIGKGKPGDVNRSRSEEDASGEAEETAGAEAAPKVGEIGMDRRNSGKPEAGRETGTEGVPVEDMGEHGQHMHERGEAHVRHMHEHMAMHHRHEHEHHMRAMGHHHESHEEMHARHEKERAHMHSRHEREMKAMHKRHEGGESDDMPEKPGKVETKVGSEKV